MRRNSSGIPPCAEPNPNTTFLECPLCNKVEPTTCKDFHHHDLEHKHSCFACKKHSAIKLWRCPCKICWPCCPTHKGINASRESYRNTANDGETRSEQQATKRRKADNLPPSESQRPSYEQLKADDIRRNLKRKMPPPSDDERMITLGNASPNNVTANLLGPSLCKRFMGSLN